MIRRFDKSPVTRGSAEPFLPRTRSLVALRRAAAQCRGCDLYQCGTRTVFGEGPDRAAIVLVGEQPGDAEDRAGRPFVGPSGKLIRRALGDAGIDDKAVYFTNAVKHFFWSPVGKRRLHKKPLARHITACRPWLEAELTEIEPEVIVCLGATAVRSVLGKSIAIGKLRGRPLLTPEGVKAVVTVHPSSILRTVGADARAAAYADLVRDLALARSLLGARAKAA